MDDVYKILNKKYLILLVLLVLTIILLNNINALTQSERQDLINEINKVRDNKENFEMLLSFLDKNFNLENEQEIRKTLLNYTDNLEININKYPNIFKEEISKQEKEKSNTTLKLIFILVILLLLIYLIKRFIKNKGNYKKEVK